MKKTISIILALAMSLALMTGCGTASTPPTGSGSTDKSAPSAADDKVYELNVSFTYAESSAGAEIEALKAVEEASNGRIKFNIYYSNSQVAIPDVPKAFADGTVDLALVAFPNYPSFLTYSGAVLSLPFMGIESNEQATRLWYAAYNELPQIQQELAENCMVPWFVYVSPGTNLFFTDSDANVISPEDLKGHKVMTPSISWQNLISDMGGAAINAAPPVYYENMSNGIADGVETLWTVLTGFGILDLIGSSTEFGTSSAEYSYFMMAMSQKTWDSLPADLQALFTDKDGSLGLKVSEYKSENFEKALAAGSESVNRKVLSDDQIALWAQAIEPYRSGEIESLTKNYNKPDVQAVFDWAINWLDNN